MARKNSVEEEGRQLASSLELHRMEVVSSKQSTISAVRMSSEAAYLAKDG